jgi:UDP-N-acetylmuramate--alanine ligase
MKINSKIHFIGIGGIGVSALARYYLSQGWKVTGSDLTMSEITMALEKNWRTNQYRLSKNQVIGARYCDL